MCVTVIGQIEWILMDDAIFSCCMCIHLPKFDVVKFSKK